MNSNRREGRMPKRALHGVLLQSKNHDPPANLDRICVAMSASRYKAVLFDLDGTLVDSYAALAEAVNHARRSEGLHDLSESRVRGLVGDGVEKLLERAFDPGSVPHGAKHAFETRHG